MFGCCGNRLGIGVLYRDFYLGVSASECGVAVGVITDVFREIDADGTV